MHEVILWCGFLGAWLLVAGPLSQAASELSERGDGVSRDEMERRMPPPDESARPSAWWWLIPPVGYLKQKRYADESRAAQMAALPPETLEKFFTYLDTATGWFYVASGALLIALKETWELVEGYEWPWWVFVAAIVVMALAAAGNTVRRVRRRHQLMERTASQSGAAQPNVDA